MCHIVNDRGAVEVQFRWPVSLCFPLELLEVRYLMETEGVEEMAVTVQEVVPGKMDSLKMIH